MVWTFLLKKKTQIWNFPSIVSQVIQLAWMQYESEHVSFLYIWFLSQNVMIIIEKLLLFLKKESTKIDFM